MSRVPDSAGADADEREKSLDGFRNYLRFLAETQLDRRLRRRIDPSDIVQETMLKAYAAWSSFRGDGNCQRAAWLRQILLREVLHAVRAERAAKRDVAREQHFDHLLDQSSERIESWLAATQTSPSMAVQEAEDLVCIADAVFQLPEAERIAVVGFYWQGASLAQLSEELGRTAPAAAGLVHRGVQRLRKELAQSNCSLVAP
ncbi:MAG: hypothetical protein CMJ58_01740 [Planctomycetaceae bacterium]|nr:hypothetical protein [Planctomycetaceae bacterium]